jgi:hypothetical protein
VTPDDAGDEALADEELTALLVEPPLALLLEPLEEHAASSAAAVMAAAGVTRRFQVGVMLNIPPSAGHGVSPGPWGFLF